VTRASSAAYAEDVGRADLDADLAVQAELFGFGVHAALDVLERLQGEVEEIPGPAGGVEHAVAIEAFEEAVEFGFGLAPGLVALLLRFRQAGGDGVAAAGPLGEQWALDDRLDQLHDGAGVGVVGAELGAESSAISCAEPRAPMSRTSIACTWFSDSAATWSVVSAPTWAEVSAATCSVDSARTWALESSGICVVVNAATCEAFRLAT